MKSRTLFAAIGFVLAAYMGLAQSEQRVPGQARVNQYGYSGGCTGDQPGEISDGSVFQDTLVAKGVNYYVFAPRAGHSYSIEAVDPIEAVGNVGANPKLTLLDLSCNPVNSTPVNNHDPQLLNFGMRISWIQSADAIQNLSVTNQDVVNHTYFLRFADTTLHNQRWSTYAGYTTQYSFYNNTQYDISGVLTVTNGITQAAQSLSVTVPAAGQVFAFVVGSNCPAGYCVAMGANNSGFATLAYIGPAGGVTADAYFVSSDARVVVPTAFGPRNYQH